MLQIHKGPRKTAGVENEWDFVTQHGFQYKSKNHGPINRPELANGVTAEPLNLSERESFDPIVPKSVE